MIPTDLGLAFKEQEEGKYRGNAVFQCQNALCTGTKAIGTADRGTIVIASGGRASLFRSSDLGTGRLGRCH